MTTYLIMGIIIFILTLALVAVIYFSCKSKKQNKEKIKRLEIARDALIKQYNNVDKKIKNRKKVINRLENEKINNISDALNILDGIELPSNN